MKIEIPDNCGRLIDADALKEAYSLDVNDEFCKSLRDAVDEAPTIWGGKKRKAYGESEAERKTGKWIEPTLKMVMNRICGSCEYLCSACNTPSIDEYDFCPNCGAKMEKSEGYTEDCEGLAWKWSAILTKLLLEDGESEEESD